MKKKELALAVEELQGIAKQFGEKLETVGKHLLDAAREEIIEQPKSILDGKVAIEVQNEREFNLLMKHYEEKGWSWNSGKLPTHNTYDETKNYINYHNNFKASMEIYTIPNYTIITFSEFAAEAGIEVPVKTEYKTEDGYDIYIGDVVSWAIKRFGNKKWGYAYDLKIVPDHVMGEGHCLAERNVYRVFSNKEAAEKWIEQANKPEEIEHISERGIKCQVLKDEVLIHCSCGCFSLSPKDIEEIHKAIQQLKGGDNA